MNPLLEAIRARFAFATVTPTANSTRIYVKLLPIKVEAVIEEHDDINLRSIIDMRNYCKEKSIHFESRLHNSRKYNIDCEFIERLPAFHLFEKKIYQETFYPSDFAYQLVGEQIAAYKIRKAEKERRKGRFKRWAASFRKAMAEKMRKETALERARRLAGPQHSAVGRTFVNLTVEQMPATAKEWT
jgi:hypothetical protein